MRCVFLKQRSDEWRKWREEGVTATDAAVILGLDPEKTPWRLWAEKVHYVRRKDLSVVPAVRYGIEHEDIARQIWERKHQDVLLDFCATYDADETFRASFDGVTSQTEPVEIKCLTFAMIDDVYLNGINSKAFKLYYPQVQHQILVAESRRGYLVFYDERRNDIYEFIIERDQHMIDRILRLGREFAQFVKERKAPPRDPRRDYFVPGDEDLKDWMRAAADVILYEDRIKACKAEVEKLEKLLESPKNELISLMGDQYLADYGGVAITRSDPKGKVDYKALVRDLLGHEPTEAELAPYRDATQTRWSFRATGQPSVNICDEDELKRIRENQFENNEIWF